MGRQMDGWTIGRMDRWTIGRMDACRNGRMNGWMDGHYVPWTAPNFDADSHQSYHGWGLVKKHPMQNFRPLEQQEPLSGWPWSFHRNLWQRQNLHNRNIDSNANSIQTSTSPWRRFLLSQRPKILHGMFFYQASTVVRLVRAIVKVWGASRDVMYCPLYERSS